MPDHLESVAEALRRADASRSPIPPVRDRVRNVSEAYRVQALNVAAACEAGRRVVGHKIGLTSPAVQEQLGVGEPDFGTLFADMSVCDGEEVTFGSVLQPRVEAEVAFVLDRDLAAPDLTITELLRSIAFALPAIEVVGSRIANWDISILDTVADNASSGMFILGTRPVALDAFDHHAAGMTLEVDGVQASIGATAACLGNPLAAVLWLARALAKEGVQLSAGEVILSGALGPMVPVAPGQVVEARIEDIGTVRAAFSKEDAA